MGIEVREILSQKDKDKRAAQYTTWLEENGYTQPPPRDKVAEDYANWLHDDTVFRRVDDRQRELLRCLELTQELIKDLHSQTHLTQAASKLATNIQELLTNTYGSK